MQIRPATESDAPALAALLSEFRGRTVDGEKIQYEFDEHFTNSPDRAVLLAVDENGDALGSLVLNLVFKLGPVECRLDEVIVSEKARGRGIGRELIAACEAWAWSHGASEIGFTSKPAREAANMLYQKTGYEIRETNVYQKKRENADNGSR